MNLNREKQGELFIFTQAILWSLFPVVTILSYSKLSPLMSLAWSTLFAAIFFAIALSAKNKWPEIKNRSALKDVLLTTFFTGFLFYLLVFFGLKYTSAGNASIIILTEVFFSFMFFNLWKKEYISPNHIAGAVLMIAGALIVLSPNIGEFKLGDILILAAAMIAPLGNFFQRRARARISSEAIMFIRSILVAASIFLLAYLIGLEPPSSNDLKSSLIFLIVNGVLLFGLSKAFWIEGIHRISVTKANALSSVSPLLTIFFAWLILKDLPTIWQLSSFFPLFFGIVLLSRNTNKNSVDG